MKNEIKKWLNHIESMDGKPGKDIIAFNFGIFESKDGYTLYLVGGFEYDELDSDWACIELPTEPYRYLKLPQDIQSKSWENVLEDVANVLKELELEEVLNQTLFNNALAITTGFDDGDLVKIR